VINAIGELTDYELDQWGMFEAQQERGMRSARPRGHGATMESARVVGRTSGRASFAGIENLRNVRVALKLSVIGSR